MNYYTTMCPTRDRLYPEAHRGMEPCCLQTEHLVEGEGSARLHVTARFLQSMEREIGVLHRPIKKLPPMGEDFFRYVRSLEVDGRMYAGGPEAVERSVAVPALTVDDLLNQPRSIPFTFAGACGIDPIANDRKLILGVVVRRQEKVRGVLELSAEPQGYSATKIIVRIVNRTPVPEELLADVDEIAIRTFASTHTILDVDDASGREDETRSRFAVR